MVVSNEVERSVLQKYRKFFFLFQSSKKPTASGSWEFLWNSFNVITWKRKWNRMKIPYAFVKQTTPRRMIWVWLVYLPRTPFFSSFLWITHFLWRKLEKIHDGSLNYFPISIVSTNFHYDRANDKENNIWEHSPLNLSKARLGEILFYPIKISCVN